MAVTFGLQLPGCTPADNGNALAHYRQLLGALSPHFTTIWCRDQLQCRGRPCLEGWTTLAYLAAEFPRFTFGSMVLGGHSRHPALLATMAATLQHLTGGRFILGLDAGWHEQAYRAYGDADPSPGVRAAQLAETVAILRAMWTRSPATYHGRYYAVEGVSCGPRPDPLIPILVATDRPQALEVVARLADAWTWDLPLERYLPPYERLRRHCAAVGRDFREIALTCGAGEHLPADPADAIARLRPLVELGVTHVTIRAHDRPTLDRFCAEVAPAFA